MMPRMMADYSHKLRLFTPDARRFLLAGTLVSVAWHGIRMVLLNLYLLRLGYGTEFIGLFAAIGSLAFALASPVAGALAGRWTSRVTMVAGLVLLAAAHGLLPLAEVLPPVWAEGWLFAFSALSWIGFALFVVSSVPFMMAATGPAERNHFFSAYTALIPLAGFGGSLLAGALPGALASLWQLLPDHPAAYRYPLWLIMLLTCAAAALLSSRRASPPHSGTAASSVIRPQNLSGEEGPAPYLVILVFALVITLRYGARGLVLTFFNVYLDDGLGVSTGLIGTLTAAGQLLGVPAALAAAPLAGRWGHGRLLGLGLGGMAFSLLPLALVPAWPAAGAAFMILAVFFSGTVGSVRVFSQEMVAPRWRSASAGAFMMGSGFGAAGVTAIAGYAIANFGYRALFLIAAGIAGLAALLFVAYFRGPRAQAVPESGG